ncbi:MerR family DNA-binding protein [Sedimenticola selenatireducens]|jgi:DNA-binding transcriptional MerR regulator|uniref:MerR family transcriptional regulator n=1 Tax=Sedimenticola selenatireducens TaxID=191960 RepID=A0A558DQD7_9GAMM|nr:MerR family transcriptional regulator [Sedimenticola selenatireducens]TVO72991.1 MerR family transcriptional regulator [Sedimenticola selenatireducens]TVT63249.1 MAG: MerR family transcriptional regulator [Sedimenticola selenatireducens]
MLTVNELAIQSDTPPHVVRYYIRIGLILPADQQDNGYRLFAAQEVIHIRFIRMAKHLGFTLNEIKQILQHAAVGESPCDDVREIIQHRIMENRIKIEEMLKLQARMEEALELWKLMPNGEPTGSSICHLIETIETDDT